MPEFIQADTAILDGEIAVLDEQGRSSFSLMQQRTGIRQGGRRTGSRQDIPVQYYVFDLLYLDGYDLRRVSLEQRKAMLAQITAGDGPVRYSDHFPQGKALFSVARQKGLEGILAKRRSSVYEERRSREWLKIKITHTVDCVIGGYTDPEGSRAYFGSIVLGLYDKKGAAHSCRPGRHRIRSGHAQTDLAGAEEARDESQSLSPRSGSVAGSALGQA